MFDQVKSLVQRIFSTGTPQAGQAPKVTARSKHGISRANISENALKVLYRLKSSGYEAYLVGGGVRDLLLGREPKDFDVATNATPEEIRRTFRNCRLIGRRFRLAHVFFGRDIIEVATFRGPSEGGQGGQRRNENGMLVRDNVYGSLEEDAWRRDFTVNALYYNIQDFSVIDHVGAMEDIKAGLLRMIGDPVERYQEDPVRMLRAVRFACKLGFRISPATEKPIFKYSHLMNSVSSARLFDEVCKLFLHGYALNTFEQLRHYGLFEYMFPLTEESLSVEDHDYPKTFIANGLKNTDLRVADDKPVMPAFLFAVLLWEPMRAAVDRNMAQDGMRSLQAYDEAADEIITQQVKTIAMPRRVSFQIKEIWKLQAKLAMRRGKKVYEMLGHPRFRAAYDFLELRHQSGEEVSDLYHWWKQFQDQDRPGQERMLSGVPDKTGTRRRRRRPRRRTPAKGGD